MAELIAEPPMRALSGYLSTYYPCRLFARGGVNNILVGLPLEPWVSVVSQNGGFLKHAGFSSKRVFF